MSLNNQLRSRKEKAFTLIELLVVIAIIALLLSILTPALRKVKGKAQNLICSTNLRSLFTAWAMYSSSNRGKICNPYTRYPGSGEFPKEDKSSWAWVPWDEATDGPVPGVTSIGAMVDDEYRFEGIRRGSLWAYTGDVDVYHCIAEQGKYAHFRSYSIVDCMGGTGDEMHQEAGTRGIIMGEYTLTRTLYPGHRTAMYSLRKMIPDRRFSIRSFSR